MCTSHSARMSTYPFKPVNVVVLDPMHVAVKQNSATASLNDDYWYNPHFIEQPIKEVEAQKDAKVRKFILNKKTLINKSPFKFQIEQALIRYVRCLDHCYLDAVFLELWSVLEFLTQTEKGAGYDKTIRRTASFYEQGEDYDRIVLEHLRERRNYYVHKGEQYDDHEAIIYMLGICRTPYSILYK